MGLISRVSSRTYREQTLVEMGEQMETFSISPIPKRARLETQRQYRAVANSRLRAINQMADLDISATRTSSQESDFTTRSSYSPPPMTGEKILHWRGLSYVNGSAETKPSDYSIVLSNLKNTADSIVTNEDKYSREFRQFTRDVFESIAERMLETLEDEYQNKKLN